jgi:hypothetical protein
MGPLHPHWLEVIGSVRRVAGAAAAQLRRPTAAGAEALEAEVGGGRGLFSVFQKGGLGLPAGPQTRLIVAAGV